MDGCEKTFTMGLEYEGLWAYKGKAKIKVAGFSKKNRIKPANYPIR